MAQEARVTAVSVARWLRRVVAVYVLAAGALFIVLIFLVSGEPWPAVIPILGGALIPYYRWSRHSWDNRRRVRACTAVPIRPSTAPSGRAKQIAYTIRQPDRGSENAAKNLSIEFLLSSWWILNEREPEFLLAGIRDSWNKRGAANGDLEGSRLVARTTGFGRSGRSVSRQARTGRVALETRTPVRPSVEASRLVEARGAAPCGESCPSNEKSSRARPGCGWQSLSSPG